MGQQVTGRTVVDQQVIGGAVSRRLGLSGTRWVAQCLSCLVTDWNVVISHPGPPN